MIFYLPSITIRYRNAMMSRWTRNTPGVPAPRVFFVPSYRTSVAYHFIHNAPPFRRNASSPAAVSGKKIPYRSSLSVRIIRLRTLPPVAFSARASCPKDAITRRTVSYMFVFAVRFGDVDETEGVQVAGCPAFSRSRRDGCRYGVGVRDGGLRIRVLCLLWRLFSATTA